VLAKIAAWREREAQSRDVPRSRVLKDEALLEIAAHPPHDAESLGHIRAVPNGYANSRSGKALLDIVKEALDGPLPEFEMAHERRRGREASPAVLDLLKTLLRLRANQSGVAPRLIANAEDLERLAAGDDDGVAALHGWRAEIFGEDAINLREGSLGLAVEDGEAVVIETSDRKERVKHR
jgi:ribonuclease D